MFEWNKFYPWKKLDTKTGELITDYNHQVHTLVSSILDLWNNVKISISNFEGM